MENQLTDSSEINTFHHQSSLPSLPVPPLDESLTKYLDAVKPFLNQEEYQRTRDIVRRFENGIGKELHKKLLERAAVKRNWLEEWWLNTAYLETRLSTQIYHNFGGPGSYIEHYWPIKEGTQIERTSISVWHILKFWEQMRKETLAVHMSGRKPLDMDQFRMLFCTCKVPGIVQDSIANYFKTENEGECPSHLIVLCEGRIFEFDSLHDGHMLSPPEIFRQLSYIKNKCGNEPEGPGLAALTSEERTSWAKTRNHLIRLHPKNLSLLEKIQRSLFVICLDESKPQATPEDYTEITRLSIAGNPTLRWGDKSYNLIAFSNGSFASNCDHAPFDAMVLVSLCSYIDSKVFETEGKWKGSDKVRNIPLPEELMFNFDQKVLNDITCAKDKYYKQVSDLQLVNYAFTTFGKALIKKHHLHPDAFVQIALQLTYYRCHGHPGCCYETATTRQFYHGRTETMRPCTTEIVEWCKSMVDPTVTQGQRKHLMLKAFARHNKLMKECENGRGFDRHLLGLQILAREHSLPVPELFLDPAFTRSGGGGNFVLSTSLVGYTRIAGAVVPMVKHGYGLFYRIRDDRIVVACSAWKSCPDTDAENLSKELFQSFQDIIQMMSTAQM
ncbi:peroxisomal carnitine O-octanoyltransferase [Thamnophis elegans]|uniref:peroxisomal carnitine O-octanoyltransferase n=1 Tax=Thamnophis elegans TaxID=35005 RepID=UPI00137742F3|nr:peroxisomal carnitine O-octanoyltransferase [Thamnophis elegans]